MDPAELAYDPDEMLRLEECAKELIRTPGMIQSHGTLFGVDPATQTFVIVSENASEWLGRHMTELQNPDLEDAVRNGRAIDPLRVEWNGRPHDAIVHATGGLTILELERVPAGLEYARIGVVTAIQLLASSGTIDELRGVVVEQLRNITGYDRVMMYHFYPDGHGEVVAEARDPELEPYLGLHFPASDIPRQARELYLSKLGRAIASTKEPGIPLLTTSGDPRDIDLTQAELRSVSPHHLEYMRNMGQLSTFSLSIIEDGKLTGMITCAHRTERRLPVLLRRSLEVLAAQIARQISSMTEISRLERRLAVRERRTALLAPLYASDDISAALLGGDATVLDLVEADGAIIRIGGTWRMSGFIPPAGALRRALDLIGHEAFDSECLSHDRPDLAELMPDIAGLLVVPLATDGDVLVFFRREEVHDVSWLGDPGLSNRPDQLSPRTSFSAWKQQVVGRSKSWGTIVEEAADLGRELDDALQRRAESQLAELAMRDALTGLYNRRYLEERLASRGPVSPDGKAMLFVDLDEFKQVNDAYGHDAGDAVILEVARRLQKHSRDQDDVVRLGGDEFVVIVDGIGDADVAAIAQRLIDAVCEPIDAGPATVRITASCGFVVAPPGSPRAGLLEAADAAMYRAKRAGRNRISD